jgi:hypothetical protein
MRFFFSCFQLEFAAAHDLMEGSIAQSAPPSYHSLFKSGVDGEGENELGEDDNN